MNKDEQLQRLCRQLEPLIGEKARALWLSYATSETPRAKMEAETFIHLVAMRQLPEGHNDDTPLLPPPPAERAKGEFELGHILYGARKTGIAGLSRTDLTKHVLISGITGSGKTNVAYNLLDQLLTREIPWLVVDWKRAYRKIKEIPSSHRDDVQVLTVGRRGENRMNWNPLRGPPGVDVQTWISVVAEALERSHVSGQGVADVFIDLIDDAFERRGFHDGKGEDYPNFFDAREQLLSKSFKGRRQLWSDSCLRILRSFTYGPAKESFNSRNPIKLETLLGKPVVIELDQELSKPLRIFFTDLLLRWLHLYRLGQGETNRLRHVIFLEEIHNLLPRSSFEKQTTNSLETVFREIRSFGQGIIGLSQHPSLLPIYLTGNCNTLMYLGLQHQEDIMMARKSLYLEPRDEKALDQLKVGEGIVKVRGRIPPCHVRFPLSAVQKSMEGR